MPVIDHVFGALLAGLFVFEDAKAGRLVHGAEYLQLIVADLSQFRIGATLFVRKDVMFLRFEAVSNVIRGLATFFLARLRLQVLEVLLKCLHRFDQ